jgi:hypothetical protein
MYILPARVVFFPSHYYQWLEVLVHNTDHRQTIGHPKSCILENAVIGQLPAVAKSGTHAVMQMPVNNLILPLLMSNPVGPPSQTLRLPLHLLHIPRPATQGHHVLLPQVAPN